MRVAIIQLETNTANTQDTTFEKLLEIIPPKDSCDLVILPELWLQGAFEFSTFSHNTLAGIQDKLAIFSQLAQKNNYWIHAGTFLVKHKDNIFNEAFVFDNFGNLRSTYRKSYIFGFGEGEANVVTAGNEIKIIESPWGLLSLAICYDLRFPELFRQISSMGAEIVLLSAAWPIERMHHWKSLITARAIENQTIMVCCNGVGKQSEATLGGQSLIVTAEGDVVLELGISEHISIYDLDTESIINQRKKFPVLKDIKKLGN
jgi:predicted amidohydrolase